MKPLRAILISGNAVAGLAFIFVSVTAPTIEIPEEKVTLLRFTLNSDEYKMDDGVGLVINGPFSLKGGTFQAGSSPIEVHGDFYLGSGATFIPNGKLQLGGKIRVDPKPQLVIDLARYEDTTTYRDNGNVLKAGVMVLLSATGSHLEYSIPTLGDVIIAP